MNSDDMDDPDLKAAIEASLQDSQGPRNNNSASNEPKKDIVDLTGDSDDDKPVEIFPKSESVVGSETEDEEDEDLKKALELSMQEAATNERDVSESQSPSATKHNENSDSKTTSSMKAGEASTSNQEQPRPTGLSGLDRKQMEQERLARVAKRKAGEGFSSPAIHSKAKVPKTDAASTDESSVRGSTTKTTLSEEVSSSSNVNQAKDGLRTVTPSVTPAVQFPEGVVKKTWVFLNQRVGDDIKIEEVLQKSDLELAVFSSFMWDMEWLFSKLDTQKTRFIMIMGAKEEATMNKLTTSKRRQYELETQEMSNLRLCFPPMPGQVNCMHSKLMLLFHAQYVRVVVPTANLTPYDWGEKGGLMENSVFLIDLPRRKSDSTPDKDLNTAFYDDLVYFLKASTLHESIIAKLENYDFSKTAHIAFVHAIGGAHTEDDAWRRTGYCGLGRSVRSLGLQTNKPLNIDYVTSSIGSLTDEFIRTIYLAAQGDDGLTSFTLRTNKSSATASTDRIKPQNDLTRECKERFRAYFPSEAAVQDSKGGPMAAGTICFQSKWYENARFPRHVLRECVSRRPGVLMHNKILFVRLDEPASLVSPSPSQKQLQCQAWAYVGSANLSESAWGHLTQDRTTKRPKLTCRNWECGVLVPVIDKTENMRTPSSSSRTGNQTETEGTNLLDAFQGTSIIPVPMKIPGRVYTSESGLRPWFFLEYP